MSRQAKGGLAAVALALMVAGVGAWLVHGRDARTAISSSRGSSPPTFVGANAPTPPALPPMPSPEEQVPRVMEAWRAAILAHDADTVLMCDRTFLSDPPHYMAALVKSAQGDGDERVRAFSTRVLGKLGDSALIPIFRQQLEDASAFVRENAAWGLGELSAPAGIAADDLAKVMKHDKADAVRRAAGEALEKVRGVVKSRRGAG